MAEGEAEPSERAHEIEVAPSDRLSQVGATSAEGAARDASPPAYLGGRRMLVVAAVATGVLLLVDLAARAFHHYITPIPFLRWLFNVGVEGNLATWWNNTLLLAVAAMALTAAILCGRDARPGPYAWFALAAAAALLSIDESVQHERLTGLGRTWAAKLPVSIPTYAWVLPGGVLVASGALLAVLCARRFPRDLRYGILGALAVYFTGALLVKLFNGWARGHELNVVYALGTTLEEGLEMSGCLIAVATISRYVRLVADPVTGRPVVRAR